jgi:radical SAM superfamily enzyme YgiQ (UPF0313 family)
MKVLLISANTERLNMPTIPLGLGLVAEATRRAGHEVRFLDLMNEADAAGATRRAIGELTPDAIGVSIRNIDDQNMDAPRFLLEQARPLIAECRAATDAPIVLGGAGYSIFPDAALAYLGADFGVRGDGEIVFPQLLDRLAHGGDPASLPGVHARGGLGAAPPTFPDELNAMPLPESPEWADAHPRNADLWIPIQSRRGCPNGCSYCSTARIQGRELRLRPPRATATQLGGLAACGFERFYFVDNCFNQPEAHALALCREIAALRLAPKWRCIIYPQSLSAELVQAMAAAGCVEVSLGFESGCDRVLREMNKRFTSADVRRIVKLLADHGIRRFGFLLLGGPGETRESVEESLAFADSLQLAGLKITVGIRIYPDTPLAARAVAEGVVEPGDDLLRPRFYLSPGAAAWRELLAGRP